MGKIPFVEDCLVRCKIPSKTYANEITTRNQWLTHSTRAVALPVRDEVVSDRPLTKEIEFLCKGGSIMAWSYIRVAIFITAFIVGLFISGSGDRPVELKTNTTQNVRESKDEPCADRNLTLIRAKEEQLRRSGLNGL